jgi:hypothetical protein
MKFNVEILFLGKNNFFISLITVLLSVLNFMIFQAPNVSLLNKYKLYLSEHFMVSVF